MYQLTLNHAWVMQCHVAFRALQTMSILSYLNVTYLSVLQAWTVTDMRIKLQLANLYSTSKLCRQKCYDSTDWSDYNSYPSAIQALNLELSI